MRVENIFKLIVTTFEESFVESYIQCRLNNSPPKITVGTYYIYNSLTFKLYKDKTLSTNGVKMCMPYITFI